MQKQTDRSPNKPLLQSPLKIETVISQMPEQQRPPNYLISHLLSSGFAGSDYQLSVLLMRLTSLLVVCKNNPTIRFEAMVEAKNFGNLDDIGIVIFENNRVISIEAYQVKHYNHPLSIYDFFNESIQDKNEKMHIGKFFDGWLSWKDLHPSLPDEKLSSIVYSNASLDEILQRCVVNNRFDTGFIEHQQVSLVGQKQTIQNYVPKNFLCGELKITPYFSTKIWNAIQRQRFIDANGCFTQNYTPDQQHFRLGLSKSDLPKGMDEHTVNLKLKEFYDEYRNNLVDLWQLLYDQAWHYLENNSQHTNRLPTSEDDRIKIFKSFLRSFRFQVNHNDLLACEATTLKNLATITHNEPEPIFLCLYYAIREWFREDHHGQTCKLNKELMTNFIEKATTRSQEVYQLQGITKLSQTSITISGWRQLPLPVKASTNSSSHHLLYFV